MKIVTIIIILFLIGMMIVRYSMNKSVSRHFGIGLIISFSIISLSPLFFHSQILFLCICFVVFFVKIHNMFDAACRFIILSALTTNITYNAVIGGAYIIDIHPTFIFLCAFVTCSIFFNSVKIPKSRFSAEDGVVLALVLILIIAESRNPSFTSLIRQILSPIFSILLPYIFITRNIRDRIELRNFFGVVAGCAMILGMFSLYEAKSGWSLFDIYWQNFQSDGFISRNLRIRSGMLRTPTTFNESTAFAVFEMVGVMAVVYSRRLYQSSVTWILSCGIVGLALLAAQSRGTLIGLAVGFTVVLLFQRSFARATVVITIAGASVVGLLAVAKFNSKAASFINADAALVGEDYRQRLLWSGLNEGMQHFWIGQERDHVIAKLDSLVQGEHMVDFVNTYLTFFLTSGIIGLMAFLCPLCLAFTKLWVRRDLRRSDVTARGMEYVVGSLTAILAALVFTSFYERNPLWLIMALAASKILTRAIPARTRVANRNLASHRINREATTPSSVSVAIS